MKVRYHPEATEELAAAAAWYEERREGLGDDLDAMVRRAEAAIAENPARWPVWEKLRSRVVVRKYVAAGFPYVLPYVVLEDEVVILAVAHGRRRPGYWTRRLADVDE